MGDMLPRKKSANKIFVGGLHWETTDEKLRKHFTIFGEVTDAVVMKDPVSRRSRGFGFITFADAGSVDRVLAQDNHILDSRRVEAKRAVPRSETLKDPTPPTPPSRPLPLGTAGLPGLLSATAAHHLLAPLPPPYQTTNPGMPATNKIFVGGLHYETKDAEFRQYFENFGRVVSAEVMFNRETHKSRGFGFVVFEDEASVDNVLQTAQHSIDGKMVEVKRAIPRNQVVSPVSAGARGLSPSFMALGGGPGGKGLLGHHLVGGPTPLSLDKAMGRPGSNQSYASVLRRGGGRGGLDGDLQGLTDGVGQLSLRNKQDALALQGLGPQNWGTIEQLLVDNMDGYHHHHHHHHHHIVRDAHAVLNQQHAHLFNQDPQQAAFLHAGLQQLGLDDYALAQHQQALQQAVQQQPSGQPPAPQQSRQTPTEMLSSQQHQPSSSRPPTSQPLSMPSSTTSSSMVHDMYPSSSALASGLMADQPSASTSRYTFASAGQVPGSGIAPASGNMLWPGAAFEAELLEGPTPPHHPPPAQHPQQSAAPTPDQQQQWEAMLQYAARAEAQGLPPTAASVLSSTAGPEYGAAPNGYGMYGALSTIEGARMMPSSAGGHVYLTEAGGAATELGDNGGVATFNSRGTV